MSKNNKSPQGLTADELIQFIQETPIEMIPEEFHPLLVELLYIETEEAAESDQDLAILLQTLGPEKMKQYLLEELKKERQSYKDNLN